MSDFLKKYKATRAIEKELLEQFPEPPKAELSLSASDESKCPQFAWPPDETVTVILKGKLSDVERNILGNAEYVADNFDSLYATNQKLSDDLEATETRLRDELDFKLKVMLDMITVKLDFLDARTIQSGIDLPENLKERMRQAHELDDIQNQVGILEFRLH